MALASIKNYLDICTSKIIELKIYRSIHQHFCQQIATMRLRFQTKNKENEKRFASIKLQICCI